MIGVLTNGQKVVLAVESGQRESKESWGMILRDVRKRGLKPWRCTIADGHLGLWAALGEQYPTLAEQRCWNHRITNVLDAMPKKHQAEARTLLCAMPYAETQTACEALRVQFTTRYRKLAPKAVERLAADWERLLTFYQFPREHWPHLRTTNVVESRLRQYGCAPRPPSASSKSRTPLPLSGSYCKWLNPPFANSRAPSYSQRSMWERGMWMAERGLCMPDRRLRAAQGPT
jgi:transposase-like protein